MVRGWEPSVEEALGALVGPARATRLALRILDDFPEPYRTRTDAHEAAQDVLRVCELDGAAARDARPHRQDSAAPNPLPLPTSPLADVLPPPEAATVLENFG